MRMQISGLLTRGAAMRAAVRVGAILLAVGLFINVPGGARAGKTSTTNENVTTIVHDLSASGAPLLLRSDDYNDPGQYEATYSVADPNLSSDIFAGAWFLRMYNQSTRTLYITPDDAINTSQPIGPPPGLYWQNVEVASRCYDQNLNQVPFENILTSSGNCLMIVDFYSGGTKYKLAMGPSLSQTLQALPNVAPATGLVTVTCNSVSNGQCMNWTITPNTATGSSNPPTVADLFYFGKSGKSNLQFIGQYYNTFRIDITYP
jgi:hypothetical protein